jgi:hypothetical protein
MIVQCTYFQSVQVHSVVPVCLNFQSVPVPFVWPLCLCFQFARCLCLCLYMCIVSVLCQSILSVPLFVVTVFVSSWPVPVDSVCAFVFVASACAS